MFYKKWTTNNKRHQEQANRNVESSPGDTTTSHSDMALVGAVAVNILLVVSVVGLDQTDT